MREATIAETIRLRVLTGRTASTAAPGTPGAWFCGAPGTAVARALLVLSALAALAAGGPAPAADELWPYAVDVARGPDRQGRPREPAHAQLWIPPDCRRVRGIIIGQITRLEKTLTVDPIIRKAAADTDLAVIFVEPSFDILFNYVENDAGRKLKGMLAALARQSRHPELEFAPMITVGHSTGGIFARNVAYWKPERVIAVIHIKSGNLHQHIYGENKSLAGVPFLAINGEFEEYGPEGGIRPEYGLETQWIMLRQQLLERRRQEPNNLMSMIVHPGGNHTSWDRGLSEYCALFIRRAVEHRVPKAPNADRRPVRCLQIKAEDGWLTDADIKHPEHQPAPYAEYTGDKSRAFWHFDAETARATYKYHEGKFEN